MKDEDIATPQAIIKFRMGHCLSFLNGVHIEPREGIRGDLRCYEMVGKRVGPALIYRGVGPKLNWIWLTDDEIGELTPQKNKHYSPLYKTRPKDA